MSFLDEEMPRRIAAGFRGGPEWNTTVNTMSNGLEQRNKNWAYARYRWTANFGAFNDADRAKLIAMFHACAGRWAAFKFRDATDCVASGESISPSIGTTTPVQLKRTYTYGGTSQVSLVQALVADTIVIYKDGSPLAGVTIDDDLGLVTPPANWAAGTYTWSGTHLRWVRFDSDWGAFVANALNAYTADMELVEVRR